MEISNDRRRKRVLAGAGLVAIACGGLSSGWALRSSPRPDPNKRPVLYYVDPMHPAYRSDKPGRAPDCGMNLEPVYAERPAPAPMTPGSIHLSREQEDAIRLETESIQMGSSVRRMQTAGRIVPVETLTYDVSASVDGWIRNTWNDETGSYVTKDQNLASFYSRDVSAPQQAYLYALESYDKALSRSPPNVEQLALAGQQLANARDNLQFVGMQSGQIDELGRLRRESPDVLLKSPCAGQILERNVAIGQRFMRGDVLYRIANLSRVWVLADITSNDELLAQSVARAQVRLQGLEPLAATVTTTSPQFAAEGRTAKLRLRVDNVDRRLIPGMVVDVSLEIRIASAMTLSAGAVLDSGTKKRVFVALGSGRYELRDVETGWQYEDRIEIIRGLAEGERVVTAGAFLLDSESRLKTGAER
jgi:membrane fusion protein, copper/silver efflux system